MMAMGKTGLQIVTALLLVACNGLAQTPANVAPSANGTDVLTYADIRREVVVQRTSNRYFFQEPRPANYFQLAGAADPELCAATLAAFNEPGVVTYNHSSMHFPHFEKRHDSVRWLLENSRHVAFESLIRDRESYSFSGLDYASIDIDGDERPEHLYRRNSVLGSNYIQNLMIVAEPLQDRLELLKTNYEAECRRITPDNTCDAMTTLISYAMNNSPVRLPDEWDFDRSPVSRALLDPASRALIQVRVDNRYKRVRNVGGSNDYWSAYRIGSRVVVVSAPILDFAPPELLVFLPKKDRAGDLQCILMPIAWHR